MDAIERVELPAGLTVEALRQRLREAGAIFAFLHGSRAASPHDPNADVDVAAWFGRRAASWEIDLPEGKPIVRSGTSMRLTAGKSLCSRC